MLLSLGPIYPAPGQERLAEMVGTTRSRVSYFMNRFRKLGFVEYNGDLKVHSSLLNVISMTSPNSGGMKTEQPR